jgi:selenide, water dikinase
MQQAPAPTPITRELVLIGGGHSHVAVIRHFGMSALPGLRVTLVTRDVHTPYSGMLPGLVAGHYDFDDCHIDLRPLCEANAVRLIHAEVSGIDSGARRILLRERAALDYDWVSINTGSHPALGSIDGAAHHGIAVKPIAAFLDRWRDLLAGLAARPRAHRIVVVGGGAAGIEIACACAWRLRQELGDQASAVTIQLLSSGELLPGHNALARRGVAAALRGHGIEVRCGVRVLAADKAGVSLDDGTRIDADTVIWAIQAGAAQWPAASGLDCDAAGFIRVQETLRSIGDERIFAAGDIAALPKPCPKSGVYAVREGAILAQNLRRAILQQPLLRFRPQRRFLSLISSGGRHALASRGPFYAAGDWVWRWKDRIDRAFMERYRAEPAPPADPGLEPAMRCGGCAAKIGGEALSRVLAGLAPVRDDSVENGIDGADDAAVLNPPPGQRLLQSVDHFRAFVDDPYLLGRIAAVHALGDITAMGARPHSALAIATVPFAGPAVVENTLRQLMQGALHTLNAEQVVLVGGHSSEGAELAFGLSVNGFAEPGQILLKSGLRPGHALILTKALGSGVLMAANAAAAARGRWIDAAIETMCQSNSAALDVLRGHGVAACTDVTGFGLLGHLLEMLRASGAGARIDADAVAALPGARECLAAGYRSSLRTSNAVALASLQRVSNAASESDTILELLIDPQTAGGLLAAVPMGRAAACVGALKQAGYAEATVIGEVDALIAPGRVQLC